MKTSDKIYLVGLLVFSALTAFLCINYGVGVIAAGDAAPRWLTIFAYVTAGYGMAHIALLSISWTLRQEWCVQAGKLIACCYLAVFVFDMARTGIGSPLEIAGLLAVALGLYVNWLAVRQVVRRGG